MHKRTVKHRRRFSTLIATLALVAALSHAWLHAADAADQGHFAAPEECLFSHMPVAIAPTATQICGLPLKNSDQPASGRLADPIGQLKHNLARGPPAA